MEVNDDVIQTVNHLELLRQDVSRLMTPLKEYHAIYAPLFGRREHHDHSEFYLKGLLVSRNGEEIHRTDGAPSQGC